MSEMIIQSISKGGVLGIGVLGVIGTYGDVLCQKMGEDFLKRLEDVRHEGKKIIFICEGKKFPARVINEHDGKMLLKMIANGATVEPFEKDGFRGMLFARS